MKIGTILKLKKKKSVTQMKLYKIVGKLYAVCD